LLLALVAGAQKQVITTEQTWLGYIQQVRFTKKWGANADAHFRTADNLVKGNNLSLIRFGGVYFIDDQTQLTAGYTYFHYYPGDAHPLEPRPEHRLWQQALWITNYPKLRVQHRLRLEERWRKKINDMGGVDNDYNFNWRARAQLQLLYPLGKKPFAPGSVALMLANEIMLNFGREIVFNTFDQNRLVTGLQLQMGKNSFLQVGYMNIFQQQASGNRYRLSHVARIFYTHNIDLRKEKTISSVIR
jgi:hypothetical protein